MTAQTTLGGMNRDSLFRIWFLFYVWTLAGEFFAWNSPWRWVAWVFGSALTCWLLYRRSMLAGIVGYIVCGTAAAAMLPTALVSWRAFLSSNYSFAFFTQPIPVNPLFRLFVQTGMAFVPTIVLALHVASRHRLLRAFEGSLAVRRHGRIIAPSSYYFVTLR